MSQEDTPCPQPQPDCSQETHLVPARRSAGADGEDANTLKLGNGDIHPDRESQQNKPDAGDRPGGKHVVSYLVKPGFILAVLKHSGVEGETWRGEKQAGWSKGQPGRGTQRHPGLGSARGAWVCREGAGGTQPTREGEPSFSSAKLHGNLLEELIKSVFPKCA